MTDKISSPDIEQLWAAIRQRDANINAAFASLNAIEAQLNEMRSIKGWRRNLIRVNLENTKAALRAPNGFARSSAGTEDRRTFTIPEGYEAMRNAAGRATGEVRPISQPSAGTDGLREMLAAAWMYGHCRARGFTFAETDIPGCKGSFLWGQAMMDAVAIMPDVAQPAPVIITNEMIDAAVEAAWPGDEIVYDDHFDSPKAMMWAALMAALSLPSTPRNCQVCGEAAELTCGPSRFGAETWACKECWQPEEAQSPQEIDQ